MVVEFWLTLYSRVTFSEARLEPKIGSLMQFRFEPSINRSVIDFFSRKSKDSEKQRGIALKVEDIVGKKRSGIRLVWHWHWNKDAIGIRNVGQVTKHRERSRHEVEHFAIARPLFGLFKECVLI